MKIFRFIGFALFAILMCLSACSSGGDDPIEPTPKPEVTKSEITIDSSIFSNGLSFSNVGGDQSISFTTNENWTLSVASTTSGTTWCTASVTSGTKGSATVKFTVTENTEYENRSVSVTIKSGTASKTFTITQKSADALLVTTNKYEIAQEGGTIEIEVKANIDYKMEISEKAKEWIKESSSRALTTYKHKLDIAMNEDAEKREGEITFKSGDKVETVKVYQAGGAIILLSQDEYSVSDAGETISVEIKSNVEFGVQMPDVDWITDEASSRGMSSHTLKYAVAPNESYDNRSAEIIFYDKNSDVKDTLKVVQAQKDAIIISQKTLDVKAEGETIEVKLSANVDFEVVMPKVDWIEQVSSRALKEHTLYFKVAENKNKLNRTAQIVFLNKESMLSDTLFVKQLNDFGHYKCVGHSNGLFGTVELYQAGVLYHYVESYIDYATDLTKLTVIGPINGYDIKVLNALHRSNPLLSLELDLSDATIVEGGECYYSYWVPSPAREIKYYTENNVIGKCMFTESKAAAITLPKSAIVIDYHAFYNNTSTTNVKTGDGITKVVSGAFSDYPALRSVHLGSSITSISDFTFVNCPALGSVHIGENVTSIGDGSFSECSSLAEIEIPNSVIKIGVSAFEGCSDLKKVHIGKGVTSIDARAFSMSGITECYCYAENPPSIYISDNKDYSTYDTFYGISKATLYVPGEKVSAYETSGWIKYFSIKEID